VRLATKPPCPRRRNPLRVPSREAAGAERGTPALVAVPQDLSRGHGDRDHREPLRGHLRRPAQAGDPDSHERLWIAAIAVERELAVFSRDRHFQQVRGLVLA
jgi:predicted nucleic acid-binding protein